MSMDQMGGPGSGPPGGEPDFPDDQKLMQEKSAPGASSSGQDESDPLGLRQYILGGPTPAESSTWKEAQPSQSAPPPSAPFAKKLDGRSSSSAQYGRGRGKGGGGSEPPSNIPYSLEAERAVLGAVLIRNESMDQVLETGVNHRDFFKDQHAKLFEVAHDLYERREPVDLVTLTRILRDRGWYDQVGGSDGLTSLFDEAFAVGNVHHYAEIVRDKAILRRMIEVCTEVAADAYRGVEDTEAFLDEAERRVFAVSDVKLQGVATDLKSILMENMSAIEELSLQEGDITGLETGFHDFDQLTTGLHPGQVMVLAARPGMGKTSWFISALQHTALKDESVIAMFSLEMSKEEIGFRFLSGLSRIDSRRLKVGKLSDRDWQRLAEAADRLSKSKIFIDDSGGLTVMDIRARARRLLAQQKRLDMIVIDYLQLMRGSKGSRSENSREREISEISRNLKELAKELKVPIIAVSQLNRGVEARQDKRPTLADLRESGAIEQDADMVCFIHRDEYYDKDTENKGVAEFIVAKNRSGEVDTIRLAWLGQYTLFANLASDAPGAPISNSPPPPRMQPPDRPC